MATEALECGVCLTLPEGEVHQCHEGHCYCAVCWNRLEEPRRCPECRQPVPQTNRSRATERAIAALEASCEHCGEATTRGAMATHLIACPQLPTACVAAVAGCGWAGVLAEQAAHEAACPFAICQRMMAPLQAQNQQVQAQNQQLQAQCIGLQSECQELQAQNQELRGRVRALEGDEEEGGRRQRQRVGAAPHDAPPSDDEVEEMELAEVVAVLRTHVAVARVAEIACERLRILCEPVGSEQAAAEAGAIEAVVAAMRAHPQEEGVQENGCCVLDSVCFGDDAAAAARKQRAAAAGAIE
jgi:TolA-binding protein